jgi:hypothetical protein
MVSGGMVNYAVLVAQTARSSLTTNGTVDVYSRAVQYLWETLEPTTRPLRPTDTAG